jgi:hypothetical protein
VDVIFDDFIGTLLRNHKSLGSGGSMVARLKLKGIDGRAPPGVKKKKKTNKFLLKGLCS